MSKRFRVGGAIIAILFLCLPVFGQQKERRGGSIGGKGYREAAGYVVIGLHKGEVGKLARRFCQKGNFPRGLLSSHPFRKFEKHKECYVDMLSKRWIDMLLVIYRF